MTSLEVLAAFASTRLSLHSRPVVEREKMGGAWCISGLLKHDFVTLSQLS